MGSGKEICAKNIRTTTNGDLEKIRKQHAELKVKRAAEAFFERSER